MENVTTAEHMAGRLDAAKLERLSAEFEAVGYVFLDNVVPDHEVPLPTPAVGRQSRLILTESI